MGRQRKPAAPERVRPHPDPEHLARADKANAFIGDPDDGDGAVRTSDDLAEALGEDFVLAATTGENMNGDDFDQVVSEEIGGPFVETSGDEEFADGADESNPDDATSEPVPTAMRAEKPPERE
jgi:hypothetical protein